MQEEYIRTGEEQIKDWKKQIEKLRARADASEDNLRQEHHRRIDDLEDKQRQGEKHLQEMKNSDLGGWEAFKKGFEDLRRDMRESIEQTKTAMG